MLFEHISRSRTIFDPRAHVTTMSVVGHPDFKPRGVLWLSPPGSWEEWLSIEAPKRITLSTYRYSVDINVSRLIKLRTLRDIKAFHHKYSLPLVENVRVIDWKRVISENRGHKSGVWIDFNKLRYYDRIDLDEYLWATTFDIPTVFLWDAPSCVTDFCVRPYTQGSGRN